MSEIESDVMERPNHETCRQHEVMAKQIAMIKKQLLNATEIDYDKVKSIKAELSAGLYQSQSLGIATKMVADFCP
ncbi:MAG: flagellar biosynthesis anti-sigma factor FlgM [Tatlockia sp.]|jgi:anti-sigma28 factor (negative regulator of flagellin synthesis)